MDVLMPQLGETVQEGTVSVWHKQVGDRVEADEILAEIETDKVSMEIPSPARGILKEIRVEAGATVPVGAVLAVVQGEGEAAGAEAPWSPPAAAAGQGAPAPAAEAAQARLAAVGGAAAAAGQDDPPKPLGRGGQQRLSPAVRRLAAEHSLDLRTIGGTGRNGRITRRDVIDFIAAKQSRPAAAAQHGAAATAAVSRPAPAAAAAASAPATARAPSPAPAPSPAAGAENRVPFTRIRRLTAEHMVRSKATSPHVLQAVEVDFSRVDAVRKAMRDAWRSRHGHSLTYLPFIAHAVCQALREFPNVNARVEGDSLVLHDYVHLGIAVDLGAEGLVAPVIKHADQLSVGQLSTAIYEISRRARENRLKPDDLSGGTYTISNNGTFGTLITAPIINQPQVAILSTDGVRKRPVVIEHPDGDSIAIRPVGILAQSFDHRAVDGAYSAAFLDRVRKLLETTSWTVDL
ncbi:MAG TPA: dihydrolipoamide acetyltransferase family protein [Gammaproteobacteria bacterium]